MRIMSNALVLAVFAVHASGVHAEETAEPSMVSFSGFGTVGAVKTNTDLGTYGIFPQEGGARKKVDYGVDSKLGLQVSATPNSVFSLTAQILTKRNGEGNWNPELEWGFAKIKLGEGFSVRVGRTGTPYFLVSDFRDVGYANTWLRPPVDVYGQVPLSHLDGVDVSYQGSIGDTNVNAQVFTGSTSGKMFGGEAKLKHGIGFNATAEYGPVTLRLGHMQGKLSMSGNSGLDGLFAGLRQAGQSPGLEALVPLAEELDTSDKAASFSGIGLAIDWNDFVGTAEYTKRRVDAFFADTTGWYVTLGRRYGVWTPYVTISRLSQDSPTSSSVIPTGIDPGLDQLAGGVNTLLASVGQKTTAIGLRWDARKNLAVKAQFDRIKVDAGGGGLFTDVKPGFGANPVNVYSLAVDFVF